VITTLREHEPELKAAGIVLRLHSSLASGTATATSDVYLIADFDASRHLSLLDMVGLENRLSDLLGPVDLSPAHTLKQPVANRAAHEAVLAFGELSLSLRDIADAIAAIRQFTLEMDAGRFRADANSVAAVERKLQVIGEAATRLGEEAGTLCPGLPCRDIRGISNWLRHQYDPC
jgi:uncharacterized protein with HEPN domain/predicted nucleotidyltransferase